MIFTNVVKPTHLCNLAYTYCYNDDVRETMMRPSEFRHKDVPPDGLYKGDVGVAVLLSELACPDEATMPFFESERWQN